MTINKTFMMKFFIFLATFFMVKSSQAQEDYSIGEIHKIQSEILNEERQLNINLPMNYSKDSVYPVLYVLDGSTHEDFLHIVGLVQFFQLQFKMPDFILVGIQNVDRKRDFTFHTDDKELQKDFPTTGHSNKFIKFLESELQPYVEANFKTNETKYIIGQSLGGLLASEVLIKKPHLFSHYLIVSPSLWWDDQSLLKDASGSLQKNVRKPIYVSISVGAKEHKVMRKDAKSLKKHVKTSKNDNISLHFNLLKKENHATILHNALYDALQELFPFQE